jgi:mxaK protein
MGVKRRTVHVMFGTAAAICAVLAGYEGFRLREAMRVNEAIAAADSEAANVGATSSSAPRAGTLADRAAGSSLPEAQFAYAVALAKRGDYEGALKQYKVLSRGSRADLATDAFYNAGNLQLREALKEGREAAVRALPLIELAKQSYRSVLRRDPQSWDARYNLERALWLAPELDEVLSESITRDAENRVMSTLQSTRADLP